MGFAGEYAPTRQYRQADAKKTHMYHQSLHDGLQDVMVRRGNQIMKRMPGMLGTPIKKPPPDALFVILSYIMILSYIRNTPTDHQNASPARLASIAAPEVAKVRHDLIRVVRLLCSPKKHSPAAGHLAQNCTARQPSPARPWWGSCPRGSQLHGDTGHGVWAAGRYERITANS